jgi:alkanesulfonate monooxygenase SsuD/methylene tetrahydromethanopterin reductase-like flavin-dependent oxidoreductase (luciferase family)
VREGLLILGDHLPDPHSGVRVGQAERQRQFVDLGVRAEALGFDSVWLGEHHLCDYILSSPPVVLAAIASLTRTLRLGTAVTLLGNLDPVRAAEDYATVDALSGGRVEVVAGRGVLQRTYRDFGRDPADSRALYRENLELLLRLWTESDVHWSGRFRAPLSGVTVTPAPVQKPHPPLWIGGGSSVESIDLAASLGLPLMLPSVLAPPQAFAPMVERYRERFAASGHARAVPRVGACSHVHVAEDSDAARRRWKPYHMNYLGWVMGLIARGGVNAEAPGALARTPSLEFERLIAGPSVCGSPAEVSDRILAMREALGLDLHIAMFDHGGMPEKLVVETLELFAARVLPELARA